MDDEDLSYDPDNLRRCLDLIRLTAGLHYFGGAFDPEHMRELANLAADGLQGCRMPTLMSHEEALRRARETIQSLDGAIDYGE